MRLLLYYFFSNFISHLKINFVYKAPQTSEEKLSNLSFDGLINKAYRSITGFCFNNKRKTLLKEKIFVSFPIVWAFDNTFKCRKLLCCLLRKIKLTSLTNRPCRLYIQDYTSSASTAIWRKPAKHANWTINVGEPAIFAMELRQYLRYTGVLEWQAHGSVVS